MSLKNSQLEIIPLAGNMGAEMRGVDISLTLDDAVFDALRQAFHEYQMIYFRGQDLNPVTQKAFTRRFGPFGDSPFVKTMDEHPEVIVVVKEADEAKVNFGGTWHSDFSFLDKPPMATLLYARETPPYGGDTMFANDAAAYEALSDGMQQLLDGLQATHSAKRSYGSRGALRNNPLRSMEIQASADGDKTRPHPLVRTHAATGRKSLFINPVYTVGIEGLHDQEASPILNYLFEHMIRPEFVCRLRWQPGTLAMWDNRTAMHNAVNDYHGHRREMHRTTVEGEIPLSAAEAGWNRDR